MERRAIDTEYQLSEVPQKVWGAKETLRGTTEMFLDAAERFWGP